MSAIFISYTGRDPEGDAWADRLAEWFTDWNYGYFRDKDHSCGIKAGEEWRPALYRSLGLAQVMVCLCSKQYEKSPWCVGEMAIALREGKTVIPIQLANSIDDLTSNPLPSMLQPRQAIKITSALNPTHEEVGEAKHRLEIRIQESLKWRDLLPWDGNQHPYPGLEAFEEHQASVFFGRDDAIEAVVQQLTRLALSAPGFLLLLGASGYGKSSLVRAGVVPRLKSIREREWIVVKPFKPSIVPFKRLRNAIREAGGTCDEPTKELMPESAEAAAEEAALKEQLATLSNGRLVVVIDQFEELLAEGNQQGKRFLAFLQSLFSEAQVEVVVVATMRTDFLALMQRLWSQLLGKATTIPLEPIPVEDYGQLISGPARRADLKLQPGLLERLVSDSKSQDGKSQDVLPLLAFTLEKLWEKCDTRNGPLIDDRGDRWDLTLADYKEVEGVNGAIRTQAEECWNPETGDSDDASALRDAFLHHLILLNAEGKATKRPALLKELPERSQPIVELMVKKRLMVARGDKTTDRTVEIAHEALLRTWKPLVQWIETGRQQLEQRRRVERLCVDLAMDHPLQARLAALQGLLLLAESDPDVARPAAGALAGVLEDEMRDPQEWQTAIRLLGLLGGEASARGLSGFLENRQLREPTPTQRAAPLIEALCQAAAALQDIHHRTPPTDDNDERWLLLPSATVTEDGRAVRSQLVRLRLWAIPRLQPPGAWFEPLGKGMALTMVAIPAGSFLMGSPVEEQYREPNEGPLHLVTLEDFWISQTPITQAQWHAVMKNNPSLFSTDEADCSRTRLPVEQVSWHDAIAFCSRLSESSGHNYTLPSEAQWEYACRAGSTTPFHCGETLVSEIANFCPTTPSYQKVFGDPNAGLPAGKYQSKTTSVDQFPSNRWGLRDMHGNVREWCLDDWSDGYADAPVDGQAWLSLSSRRYDAKRYDSILATTKKRLRGGDWGRYSLGCRSASRHIESSHNASHSIGFRVVCLPGDPFLST